ncbi:MAG: M20/M25/M40 family metallo-hydrolase [Firmicutes bacterium]|nr:M20/M25/M40 family metallo-hydrolase [Bacillota bacterium]
MNNSLAINEERLIREFIRLAEIPSPSFREGALKDYLSERLKALGLEVEEDETGAKIGGDCGNLLARLPGDGKYPAVFFCAHMDTVEPAAGVEVVFQDGVFRSKGDTILGGDDKAGIAAILEVLEMLRVVPVPHGPLEIIFTVGEEQGLLGSKNLDFSKVRAKFGYVLDSSGPPGTVIVAAPAQNKLDITVRGRAAHAGIDPERGINAIQAAGQALAQLRLGRIDTETTANIGVIEGGKATNIVPDLVYIQGEVRSIDRKKMEALTEEIAAVFNRVAADSGAKSEVKVNLLYPEFRLDPELPLLKYAAAAAQNARLPVRFEASGGGSDANIFNAAGIPAANLSIGMQQVHTTEEHLDLRDLVADVRWLWEIIKATAAEREKSS